MCWDWDCRRLFTRALRCRRRRRHRFSRRKCFYLLVDRRGTTLSQLKNAYPGQNFILHVRTAVLFETFPSWPNSLLVSRVTTTFHKHSNTAYRETESKTITIMSDLKSDDYYKVLGVRSRSTFQQPQPQPHYSRLIFFFLSCS